MLPDKLKKKLEHRSANQSLRNLGSTNNLIDFSSNDYLGFSKDETIFQRAHNYLIEKDLLINGAKGSRLLSGNHVLYPEVEKQIADFHSAESALIFNSGYDANLGFFSCIPQRNDIIFYDELCHASIRDGVSMSNSKAYKFTHNDLSELSAKIQQTKQNLIKDAEIYIITESVFSMDGDTPELKTLSTICQQNDAKLIIDEAHAVGVFGENGQGLINHLKLEASTFARLVTFGKALGAHGAAILGSSELKQYLINFSRPLIYTTGLPPYNLATIKIAYDQLNSKVQDKVYEVEKLRFNIQCFQSEIKRLQLNQFIDSDSAIQSCIIAGNSKVKKISERLKQKGYDVKPILSPTVPLGKERLRFCLHSFNSKKQISDVLQSLAIFVKDANI
ncbi:MAG: pyridoxal phosphate-dependent aminotransferase family protein [Bacteroidota bacterium]